MSQLPNRGRKGRQSQGKGDDRQTRLEKSQRKKARPSGEGAELESQKTSAQMVRRQMDGSIFEFKPSGPTAQSQAVDATTSGHSNELQLVPPTRRRRRRAVSSTVNPLDQDEQTTHSRRAQSIEDTSSDEPFQPTPPAGESQGTQRRMRSPTPPRLLFQGLPGDRFEVNVPDNWDPARDRQIKRPFVEDYLPQIEGDSLTEGSQHVPTRGVYPPVGSLQESSIASSLPAPSGHAIEPAGSRLYRSIPDSTEDLHVTPPVATSYGLSPQAQPNYPFYYHSTPTPSQPSYPSRFDRSSALTVPAPSKASHPTSYGMQTPGAMGTLGTHTRLTANSLPVSHRDQGVTRPQQESDGCQELDMEDVQSQLKHHVSSLEDLRLRTRPGGRTDNEEVITPLEHALISDCLASRSKPDRLAALKYSLTRYEEYQAMFGVVSWCEKEIASIPRVGSGNSESKALLEQIRSVRGYLGNTEQMQEDVKPKIGSLESMLTRHRGDCREKLDSIEEEIRATAPKYGTATTSYGR